MLLLRFILSCLSLSFSRCRRSLSFLVGILPIDVLVLDSKTGNEGHGMTPQQKKICDGFVYIKQYGAGTASLNVAVASSIVMHEFAKYHNYSERAREGEKFIVAEKPLSRRPKGVAVGVGWTPEIARKEREMRRRQAENEKESGSDENECVFGDDKGIVEY